MPKYGHRKTCLDECRELDKQIKFERFYAEIFDTMRIALKPFIKQRITKSDIPVIMGTADFERQSLGANNANTRD